MAYLQNRLSPRKSDRAEPEWLIEATSPKKAKKHGGRHNIMALIGIALLILMVSQMMGMGFHSAVQHNYGMVRH